MGWNPLCGIVVLMLCLAEFPALGSNEKTFYPALRDPWIETTIQRSAELVLQRRSILQILRVR